jgi:hypothetical protein
MRKSILLTILAAGLSWMIWPSAKQSIPTLIPQTAVVIAPPVVASRGSLKDEGSNVQKRSSHAGLANADGAASMGLSSSAQSQIEALQKAKSHRTSQERKISSQFIHANMDGSKSLAVPGLRTGLQKDSDGRILVDITAKISEGLVAQVRATGASILNQFPEFDAMRAWVPFDGITALSASSDVTFIRPAVGAKAHAGKVTSQGDVAHGADLARTDFGVTGAGVKVGVLSDNLQYLTQSQGSADLSGVSVLTGQSGSGVGEGTAMLEIIHDLAPDAALYFATAMGSPAAFAKNIQNLQAAGCQVIVDDVGYFDESPFQDGIIAKAVNAVTAKGALYFSAAGNSGSKNSGVSSTWEGNFQDGGTNSYGTLHNFGAQNYNVIQSITYDNYAALFWADPLGASQNDYDLYLLDETGQKVVAASDDYQGGRQDPYEFISSVEAGERIIIVLSAGLPRFLHLETGGAPLSLSTTGSTKGHNCAQDAFCVAAVSANSSGEFSGEKKVSEEKFSSDGPRRVFFSSNGTALTPGNFLSSGGVLRRKPDIAAADGVRTSVPGFNPFYGTSAAAPHAAALAALLKSAKTNLTSAQIRSALTTGTIDSDASGWDENSGYGIVMAPLALAAVRPANVPATTTATPAQLNARLLISGDLEISVAGTVGQNYTLEVSTNLTTWTTLRTLTNSVGTVTFREAQGAAGSYKYFRASAQSNRS